ncbi:MAG: hypothetical protein ACOYJS_05935 [Acutalibacteraceae bacterium]|jgi:hypothetical protein
MDNNSLRPINNEADLDYYRNRLDNMNYDNNEMEPYYIDGQQMDSLWNHLRNQKGKLVRVETRACTGIAVKVGVLMDVGSDFIELKLCGAPVSVVIPVSSIFSITVVHDNDRRKIFPY